MGTKKVDILQSAQITALQTDVGELRTKLNLIVPDAVGISAKLNILINDLNDMNDVVMQGYTPPATTNSYGILKALDIYQNGFDEHKNLGSFIDVGHHSLIPPATSNTSPMSPYFYNTNSGPVAQLPNFGWTTHSSALTMQVLPQNGNGGGPAGLTAMGEAYIAINPAQLSPSTAGGGVQGAPAATGNSGSNAPGSSLAPNLPGTGQGTNSAHSADAASASVIAEYQNRQRLLEAPSTKKVNRAKQLVRNILNKLRSK